MPENKGRNTATQNLNTTPAEHALMRTKGERIGELGSEVEPKTQAKHTRSHSARRRRARMRGPGNLPATQFVCVHLRNVPPGEQ